MRNSRYADGPQLGQRGVISELALRSEPGPGHEGPGQAAQARLGTGQAGRAQARLGTGQAGHRLQALSRLGGPGPGGRRRRSAGRVMITANYLDARVKVHMIMKTVTVCPIFDGDFSPDDEFSVYFTAKSPSSEKSP